MRISGINLGIAKNAFRQNNANFSKPNLVNKTDSISFTSKTKEQAMLTKEAKDLSKEAYMVFARGKSYQKQSQKIIDKSNQIISKANKMQHETQKKWNEIESELEYASEYKVKASADPIKNTQTVFDISNKKNSALIIEYKDGKEIRKVDKRQDIIELTEDNNHGKVTRTIFDANTGEVIRIDFGYKQTTPASFVVESSYEYKDGQLVKHQLGLSQNSRMTTAKATYVYRDGFLDKYSINSTSSKNGFSASEEEYWFEKDALAAYFKGHKIKTDSFASSEEEYVFGSKIARYIKNKNRVFNSTTTADKVFCYSDSKIQKAIVGLNGDCDSRMIEKYFIYDKKERPLACHLNYQTNGTYELDFDSDFNSSCDKLVFFDII